MENNASQRTSSSPRPDDVLVNQTTPPSTIGAGSQESSSQGPYLSQGSQQESSSLDLEKHPKGKRKRTAAKDKAILEAAYHANPKPDKAARLDIVKRVSLNEKEVQIWFQNRRQNDRRKSRPLSPQEIAALRYGGMQILSSDPAAYNNSSHISSNDHSPDQSQVFAETRPTSPARSEHGVFSFERDDTSVMHREDHTRRRDSAPLPNESGSSSSQTVEAADDSFQLSRSFPGPVGYLANRWNAGSSFSTPSSLHRTANRSVRPESFPMSASAPNLSPAEVLPAPSSQSSQFRLSLSLEGKAQVIESNTPPHLPPPRPSPEALAALAPVARPNLQRSHSSQSSVTLPPISTLTGSLSASNAGPLPPRLTRGRSRDVHAWEFCCDADSQEDPLIAQAKYESSGSAIAQISLIRSTSATGGSINTSPALQPSAPLQPSSSAKRNAPMSKEGPRDGSAKKPKLARWSTAAPRLQTSNTTSSKDNTQPADKENSNATKEKSTKISILTSPSGNDSDKENWSPDEDGIPQYRFQSMIADTPSGGARRPHPPSSTTIYNRSTNSRRTGSHHSRNAGFLESSPLRPSYGRNSTAPGRYRSGKAMTPTRLEIFEDSPPRTVQRGGNGEDDEVERFMRGDVAGMGNLVTPAKKCDVDAVAGLLSLSQGKWR